MLLTIILVAIGSVICFLLVTPLVIEVDSARHKYGIYYRGIAAIDLRWDEGLYLQLWVLGWRKTIEPFGMLGEKPPKKKKPEKPKRKRMAFSKIRRKLGRVLRSFTVKRFYVNVDTGDYPLNAILYPLAGALSNERRTVCINFTGDVVVRIRIENRLGKILYAIIR